MSNNEVRIQDDLYQAVNGKWLETAVIPDDRPTTGGFAELDQNVEKLMMSDFAELANGTKTTDIEEMKYAIGLYRRFLDTESRNAAGIKPLLPYLEKIQSITSIEQLNEKACELLMNGLPLPVQVSVDTDMKDVSRHCFALQGPDIILPDTTYYDSPAKEQLIQVFSMMASQALSHTSLSEEEQHQYLADTLAYDELISKKVKSGFSLHNHT